MVVVLLMNRASLKIRRIAATSLIPAARASFATRGLLSAGCAHSLAASGLAGLDFFMRAARGRIARRRIHAAV
jgi:hypothetical protein